MHWYIFGYQNKRQNSGQFRLSRFLGMGSGKGVQRIRSFHKTGDGAKLIKSGSIGSSIVLG